MLQYYISWVAIVLRDILVLELYRIGCSAPTAPRDGVLLHLTPVLPSLPALPQDRSMLLGPTIDVDVIYPVLLLLVPAPYRYYWPLLSTDGPFYSKLRKHSLHLAGVLQEERGGTLIRPEPSRQNTRTENVNAVSLRRNRNDNGVSQLRGDTLPSSDSLEISPKFYTSPPTSTETHSPNSTNSQVPRSHFDHQAIRKRRNTDSSSSSSSTIRAGMLDSGEFHLSLGRQQSINDAHEPSNEVDELAGECAGHGQDETLGGVKSEQFVSQAGSNVVNNTTINGTDSGISAGIKDSPSLSEHTNTSGIDSQASGSCASTVQSGADCGSRSNPKGVPPRVQAGDSEVTPGAEGVARRTGPEVKHPVQESGLHCSSDLVLTVPVIPRRTGLVLGQDTLYVFVYVLCVLLCSCACVYECI